MYCKVYIYSLHESSSGMRSLDLEHNPLIMLKLNDLKLEKNSIADNCNHLQIKMLRLKIHSFRSKVCTEAQLEISIYICWTIFLPPPHTGSVCVRVQKKLWFFTEEIL